MNDFWDNLRTGNLDLGVDSFDNAFQKRKASPIQENFFRAGVRVAFKDSVEAILSYPDFPQPYPPSKEQAEGVVVRVRTSSGDATMRDGFVFVQWDDGHMRRIHHRHLKPAKSSSRRANGVSLRVSSLGDLSGFIQGRNQELVHKATKDLWSFRKEGDDFVIERLFDSNGEPLKGV